MNEVMTEPEAAQYLRLSTKTLQRRRRDGQIAYIRDGGIRYLMPDLQAYLEARRTAVKTSPPSPQNSKYRRAMKRDHDVVDLLFG
ncbi:MAG TPA: hypothetical protein DC031_10450 [Sulfitobacter sp.]|jgi:excisionase family DNA binding protein|uniref:helix-turn-helix domain-containing protein n=1 Tax=Sulfitobacter dubius TaxID=218673 RepID=UPI000C5749B4|nr:hypothetical protein [Sulfitobacter sp.]HBB83672.1 hypothetical protein [Sulfitobacter sp.]